MSLLIWYRLSAWLLIRLMPYQSYAKIWKWPTREQVWGSKADKHERKGVTSSRQAPQWCSHHQILNLEVISPLETRLQLLRSWIYMAISKPPLRVWGGQKTKWPHQSLAVTEAHPAHSCLCEYLSEFTLGLIWQEQPGLEWLWMQNGNYS